MFDKNFFDEIPSTLINLRKRLPKLIVNMHNKNISESLIANFPLYQKEAVIFKNGAIYQGQWSKDVKICGNGIMYLPKESILLEGYFIKNSLYLSNNKIYLYGSTDDYSVNTIKERYKKYNLDINVIKKDRQYIIEITNKNKYNSLKSNIYLYLYNTVDFINKLIDSTGDVMTR